MTAAETEAAVNFGASMLEKMVSEIYAIINASVEHSEAERAALIADIKKRLAVEVAAVADVKFKDV